MRQKESLKKNYLYQSAYQVLTVILPMLTSPYVSRVLGAEGIGIYSYTFSIVTYFVLFAKLGLHNYGNRCIATVRDDPQKLNQTFSDLYALHVLICLTAMALYAGYVHFFGGEYRTVFLIQGLYLIGQLMDINWFYFGLEKFRLTVTRNMAFKILTVVCVFLFVRTKEDVGTYVLILAAGSAVSESVVWLFLRGYVKPVKPKVSNFRRHIGPMLVFFIPSVAVSLYKVMDKIMLGAMTDTAQVGYYENSEKIINISLGFVTALGTVMMPRMTHLLASGHEGEGKQLFQKSSGFILIFSYAMAFGIAGVSGVFPAVFWGKEFTPCGILLAGLAVSLPFTAFANVIRTQYLIPRHRDRAFIGSVCAGAAVNFVMNLLCIPRWQAFGAVVGTVAAEAAVCLIQIFAVRKEEKMGRYLLASLPFLLFGAGMGTLVYLIGLWRGPKVTTLIIQVAVGGFLYLLPTWIYFYRRQPEMLETLRQKTVGRLRKKS